MHFLRARNILGGHGFAVTGAEPPPLSIHVAAFMFHSGMRTYFTTGCAVSQRAMTGPQRSGTERSAATHGQPKAPEHPGFANPRYRLFAAAQARVAQPRLGTRS